MVAAGRVKEVRDHRSRHSGKSRINWTSTALALLPPQTMSPPVRPSDLPRRPRRGDDGHLLFYIETSVAKPIQRALDKPWLELDLGVRLEAIEFHRHF